MCDTEEELCCLDSPGIGLGQMVQSKKILRQPKKCVMHILK